MRKAVIDKVNSGPRAAQLFFKFAYDYKLKQIQQGYDTPLLNRYMDSSFDESVRSLKMINISFYLQWSLPHITLRGEIFAIRQHDLQKFNLVDKKVKLPVS